MRLRFFLFKLIILVVFNGNAQKKISFRQLSVNDGLSQNSAISVSQDSIGYLWIATQDGLNRYDGNEFLTYPFTFTDITKPDYSILGKVYTDRQGGLWIIPSDKKLYNYSLATDSFEQIQLLDDASTIFQDHNLNFWVGTFSNGLFLMNTKKMTLKQIIPYEMDPSQARIDNA